MKTLLLRADATPVIGGGHVMRCLAIAQEWLSRPDARVLLVSAELSEPLADRARAEGVEVRCIDAERGGATDADLTCEIAARTQPCWIVIDGYAFTTEYQSLLRRSASPVLAIDDEVSLPSYDVDVVLNQNMGAESRVYPMTCGGQALLGSRYVLLRREYLTSSPGLIRHSANKLVVTTGAADHGDLARSIVDALGQVPRRDLEVRVIAGPLATDEQQWWNDASKRTLGVELVTGGTNMPQLLGWADVAITAAGSTCWELAWLGIPMIAIPLAANQLPIAFALAERGAAVHIDPHRVRTELGPAVTALLADYDRRRAMSRIARQCVDGKGAARVVDTMLGMGKGASGQERT